MPRTTNETAAQYADAAMTARADRGQGSIRGYAIVTFGAAWPDDYETAASDLIADVMHALNRDGRDYREVLARAEETFAGDFEDVPSDADVIAEGQSYGLDIEPDRCDIATVRETVAAVRELPAKARPSAVRRANQGHPIRGGTDR
jgi:hypothetical protein